MNTIQAIGLGPIQGLDFASQAQLNAAAQNVQLGALSGTLSFSQIESLWISNGGAPGWAPLMAGIALAESGGNTKALNNNPATGDYSVGLWQINYFGSMLGPRTQSYGSPSALQNDPNLQAKAAIALFGNNGAGLSNWTNDKTWNAWVADGRPQQPSASTVLAWLAKAGVTTGGGGANVGASGAASPSSSSVPGTCGYGQSGINLDPLSSVPIVGSIAPNVTILNKCQVKAITGGLLVGIGAMMTLTGVILIAATAAAGSKAGQQAAGLATQIIPEGRVAGALGGIGRSSTASRAVAGARKGAQTRRSNAQAEEDERLYQQARREALQPKSEARKRFESESRAARTYGPPRTERRQSRQRATEPAF